MKFAEIKMLQIAKLLEVEIDDMFVSNEAIEQIVEILNLGDGQSEDELRAIRNSIVKIFDEEFITPILDAHEDYGEYRKYETKMSGIVAVIDSVMWRCGYEV